MVSFLGDLKTPKFHSEIHWPLVLKLCQQRIINAFPESWILFCYIFAITNLQSVAVLAPILDTSKVCPKATFKCFKIKECKGCHFFRVGLISESFTLRFKSSEIGEKSLPWELSIYRHDAQGRDLTFILGDFFKVKNFLKSSHF